MMKYYLLSFYLLLSLPGIAQYPPGVRAALNQAKTNEPALRKALEYFYQGGDALKIRSINFLITNMPPHSSQDYYWADRAGKRILFNELAYPSFNDAVAAIDHLKTLHPGMHPVAYQYRDIDSVSAEELIGNIDLAVDQYRKRQSTTQKDIVTEEEFLEYVLPYRVSVEPKTRWRKVYLDKYAASLEKGRTAEETLTSLKAIVNSQFKNLWGQDHSPEPLPRLSALQILLRRKGYCEDLADMVSFIARSQGVPATVDNIPYWGTTTGNHFLNYLHFDKDHRHFDAVLDSLGREPGKVLRTTYSSQPAAIASWLDSSLIPPGFLRLKNYRDVTEEYWPTDSIDCQVYPDVAARAVFLAVLNGAKWQPVWYARREGRHARFFHMSKGVVYLPVVYAKGRLTPAGNPVALGYRNKAVLQPDLQHTRSITIRSQERYLNFREGKMYRLLMWNNNEWQWIGERKAPADCTELMFDKVPRNTLLLLVPEYSQGKERPFIILDNGERVWW